MARIYHPNGLEALEPTMIWADRLAIGIFLLTGGLIGTLYLFAGDPGSFQLCEQISACVTTAIWFSARVLDFIITGRIRQGS